MDAVNGTHMVTCDAGSGLLSKLKRMSDSEFMEATDRNIDLSQFPLDALAYMANRAGGFIGGCSGPRRNSRKDQSAYVVYWITYTSDSSVPLYVGITKNLDKRWRDHRCGSKELAGIKDLDSITIRVIDTVVGTLADAEAVEIKHIKHAAGLNPSLLNRRRN